MPFAYYDNLSPVERLVYDVSDGRRAIRLPRPEQFHPQVEEVREALEGDRRVALQRATSRLCNALFEALGVRRVVVEVLEVRPSDPESELHGLYTLQPGKRPRIQVWMRTAKHARVVKFRTFLRTVLHEACHHLDLELLGLPLSFHTEGFFKRETSLFWQLVPRGPTSRRASGEGSERNV
ncbi:MAG TPA: hypothetical protein VK447_02350 [Myxococcaceae bacterium]|nr:hypothetical protein [Myxococcaceae bacterium]